MNYHLCIAVDQVGEAFSLSSDEFSQKYGFQMPEKSTKV